jgi:hypothetical protein
MLRLPAARGIDLLFRGDCGSVAIHNLCFRICLIARESDNFAYVIHEVSSLSEIACVEVGDVSL